VAQYGGLIDLMITNVPKGLLVPRLFIPSDSIFPWNTMSPNLFLLHVFLLHLVPA
jgi:hypothetical protein